VKKKRDKNDFMFIHYMNKGCREFANNYLLQREIKQMVQKIKARVKEK